MSTDNIYFHGEIKKKYFPDTLSYLDLCCISGQSDQSLCCPHKETLHHWLNVSSEDSGQTADLNLCRKHMFEGMFSDIAAHIRMMSVLFVFFIWQYKFFDEL